MHNTHHTIEINRYRGWLYLLLFHVLYFAFATTAEKWRSLTLLIGWERDGEGIWGRRWKVATAG
jgi:hypothetical protein